MEVPGDEEYEVYRMRDLDVRVAESPDEIEAVRQLWRDYWRSFGLSMDFQGFGQELQGLPGACCAEGGLLLLAFCNDEPAGTIALRRLDRTSGEVKRLYLRPQFRGHGLGRRLLEAVIERARALGYESLYADTLPVMTEALSLYERMGFGRVEAYSSAPTPGAIYMKLKLVSPLGRASAEAL
jgi:putative acetyltransferase